jgi:hypothetical protein
VVGPWPARPDPARGGCLLGGRRLEAVRPCVGGAGSPGGVAGGRGVVHRAEPGAAVGADFRSACRSALSSCCSALPPRHRAAAARVAGVRAAGGLCTMREPHGDGLCLRALWRTCVSRSEPHGVHGPAAGLHAKFALESGVSRPCRRGWNSASKRCRGSSATWPLRGSYFASGARARSRRSLADVGVDAPLVPLILAALAEGGPRRVGLHLVCCYSGSEPTRCSSSRPCTRV